MARAGATGATCQPGRGQRGARTAFDAESENSLLVVWDRASRPVTPKRSLRDALWGHRGERVGEARRPGPPEDDVEPAPLEADNATDTDGAGEGEGQADSQRTALLATPDRRTRPVAETPAEEFGSPLPWAEAATVALENPYAGVFTGRPIDWPTRLAFAESAAQDTVFSRQAEAPSVGQQTPEQANARAAPAEPDREGDEPEHDCNACLHPVARDGAGRLAP